MTTLGSVRPWSHVADVSAQPAGTVSATGYVPGATSRPTEPVCPDVVTDVIGPVNENVPSGPTVFLTSTRRPCWSLVNVQVTVSPASNEMVAVGLATDVVDWFDPAESSPQTMLFNSHAGVVAGSNSETVYVPGVMSPLLVEVPRVSVKSAGGVVLASQLCSKPKVSTGLPVPVLLTMIRAC